MFYVKLSKCEFAQ
jgi:hypothetical protein